MRYRSVRRVGFGGAFAAALLAGASIVGGWRSEARACGGLFCNAPPPNPFDPLPIAQSGENIVFGVTKDAKTGGTVVEAHIQIFYAGPADKFSWIVPVDAQPTVDVGSDQLFTAVAVATAPSYRTQWVTDGTCKPEPVYPNAGGSAPGIGPMAGTSADAGVNPGLEVTFRGAVGPYDTAVIHSTTRSSAELTQWLSDNGYFVGDTAKAIIDEYVGEGKYFVAIKLLNGKDVQSIQPVVLRFAGAEPCVPLRLTAVAALKDLQVNLWVLGDSRAVPKNYFEFTVNEARINWLSGSFNYAELVKQAANEVGGKAFIAEYAGTARILDRALWPNPRIDLAALRAADTPPVFLQRLVAQGLAGVPQMLSLLRTFIPEPQKLKDMGIPEALFYANNAFYWMTNSADFAPFDASKLTDEIDKAIVMPLRQGQELFNAHPYLTRLATFISPEEMTHDPFFIFNEDLPTVSNVHSATAHLVCGDQAYRQCEAPVRLELADGRKLWFRRDPQQGCYGQFQQADLEQMPAVHVAYQRAEAGEGNRVADNTKLIAASLAQHNQPVMAAVSQNVPPALSGIPDGTVSGSGCGCNYPDAPIAASAAVALLLALALMRRARA